MRYSKLTKIETLRKPEKNDDNAECFFTEEMTPISEKEREKYLVNIEDYVDFAIKGNEKYTRQIETVTKYNSQKLQ